ECAAAVGAVGGGEGDEGHVGPGAAVVVDERAGRGRVEELRGDSIAQGPEIGLIGGGEAAGDGDLELDGAEGGGGGGGGGLGELGLEGLGLAEGGEAVGGGAEEVEGLEAGHGCSFKERRYAEARREDAENAEGRKCQEQGDGLCLKAGR